MVSEIALFHLGALGDLVVSVPAFHAIRRAAGPRTRVLLFAAGAARGEMLRRGGAAHEALDLGRPDLAPLFRAGGRLPGPLARRAAGWASATLLLRGASEVAANLRAAGVPRVVEVPPRPPEGVREHVIDWLLRAAAGPRGCSEGAVRVPRLRVPAADRRAAAAELAALGIEPGRGLALHPGSGGRRKRWPLERFIEIARRSSGLGRRPFFILGPVELDAAPEIEVRLRESGFPAIRDPSLPRLAALARSAGLYLGNDAGPTHLAAAAGARTVALFGAASDPAIWAPRGREVRLVRAPGGDLGALGAASVLDVLAMTGS